MRFLCYVALAGSVLLSGCASTLPVRSTSSLEVVEDGAALPPPSPRDLSNQARQTVLGPYDKISIAVFGLPDLGGTVQADASGRISVPLGGEININGKTTAQVEQAVAEAFARGHIRDPRVSVNLVEAVSQQLAVEGEVGQPGLYPVIGDMTLLRAIASARGVTEFAQLNHVVVFRQVDERRMAALYDVRAIRSGLYEDPRVYANDVVVVGTSQARRIFRDIIQGSGLITTPVIALLQRP